MKIAFISYWSCPMTRIGVQTGGGMSIYLFNLANHFAGLGHTVDIFTRTHRDNDEKVLNTHKNVRIVHLRQESKDLYRDTSSFANKILSYIKKENICYDLLHAHYFYSGLVGIYLKKTIKLPLFSTFHSLAIPKKIYAGIGEPERIKKEIEIIENSEGIIASTEIERRDLISLYSACRKKIFVIAPGVNHQLFKIRNQRYCRGKLKLPLDKNIVLFVGRIDPIKNISVLIQALSRLHDHYPNFKHKVLNLLIGGDIHSRNFWKQREVVKIDKLIKEKNISCCVKFIGSKPMSILPYFYAASDLVVMPSKYESFGLVILEAMACARAVVASKVGGLKILVKDKENGRLFESNNHVQLAQIIWELIGNSKQRKILGTKAYRYSQAFGWDKQAEKIIKIYRKFI